MRNSKSMLRSRSKASPVVMLCSRVAVFLLATCMGAFAQDFQVRAWATENGLSDRTIAAMAQTADGYLWVGTPKGLDRFDGSAFVRVETSGDTTLKDASIVGLMADRQDGLWIASESGLITEFSRGKFQVRYPADGTLWGGAAHPRLYQAWRNLSSVFGLDHAGAVWATTPVGTVIRFADEGPPVEISPTGLPAGGIHGLVNDGSGRVWLLKGTNACFFEGGKWSFASAALGPGAVRLWCAAGNAGFWKTETVNAKVFASRVTREPAGGWQATSLRVPTTPAHPAVTAMLEDHQGRLWLASKWGGVCIHQSGGDWRHVQTAGPLAKGTAQCLFEDRQGSVWVGTVDQGLDQVLDSSVRMILLPPQAADLHATTVAAGRDGSLWIGTDSGLYLHEPGAAAASEVPDFTGQSIYAVLEDSRSNLWVGAQDGLFRRDASGFKREPVQRAPNGGILALFEDHLGGLWAGGFNNVLWHRPPGSPGWSVIKPSKAMPVLSICSIAEDKQGEIWVGSKRPDTGLGRVERDCLAPPDPALDVIQGVHSILGDAEGAVWIGTYNDGLFRWSHQVLQHYTGADGLPDEDIFGMKTDDRGNLWMSTRAGIVGCALSQLTQYQRGQSPPLLCLQLGSAQGMANPECAGAGQPVMARGADGRFWVATMSGLAGFQPAILSHSVPTEAVRVDTLMADGVAREPGVEGIRLPASTRRFEFRYSVPEFAFPQGLRFRYRLDGLDRDWIDAGPARVASYSQLPPGTYLFRVMVGGGGGQWRETTLPVSLVVLPQFWQTLWFRALAIATVLAALTGGAVWNERRKFRLRMARLEAQQAVERARQRIARDLHDGLGSAITEILQLGYLTLQPHLPPENRQSNLQAITHKVHQLSVAVDEIVWTQSSRNDTLASLAGYLSSYTQEFLRHSGIVLRLDVPKNLPDAKVNSRARHHVLLAVKEALNNVAKHSGADKVSLQLQYAEGVMRVAIEDNGRGFNPDDVREGEGLSNMRERLRDVGGRAEFQSQPGGGARVVFVLGLTAGSDENHHK